MIDMQFDVLELHMPRGVYQKSEEHGQALAAALQGNQNRRRHGESTRRRRSPEHVAWQNMRARCRRPNHPSYGYYGARGITICDRWDSFENFLEDVGRRPGPGYSLDRIDNDGNYEPGNCRWATRSEQMRNNRQTKLNPAAVATIRAGGDTLASFARRFGVSEQTVAAVRDGRKWAT